MHSLYNFHFLNTISLQLQQELENLTISDLNEEALTVLENFQQENKAHQGVYLLHYDSSPVYLGKAENIASRLEEHYWKLSGRENIDLTKVGYKALLLDKSMSTAANENVLINLFAKTHQGMWNGKGFGPKDPGKERDTTKPGYFDRTYPIKRDYVVENVEDDETIASVLSKMKAGLPYIVRYELKDRGSEAISLKDKSKTASSLLQAVVNHLGGGWKGAILSYGMIVYQTQKDYSTYATEILPES